MKSIIISLFIVASVLTEVSAACKWRYVNEINKDITHASGLLSDYAKCLDDCAFLAKGLNRMLLHLRQSSQCGAHILTRENGNAIGFIGDRYKLIYKQKTGKNWTSEEIEVPELAGTAGGFWSTKPAEAGPATSPARKPVQIEQPASTTPYSVWRPAKPQPRAAQKRAPVQQAIPLRQARPQPRPVPKTRQRMAISREAYRALWPEHHRQQPQRPVPQRAISNRPRRGVTPQQLAKQRAIQQRKQLIIQQQLIQRKNAQKRAIQHRLNQQRLVRIRLQKQRQLKARLERNKRIQQQRMIIAQRNRNR